MPPLPAWLTATTDGCLLTVKATPRASRSEVAGADATWLRIRLQAPPVDGRANTALLEFLADRLDLPRRAVTLHQGETARIKKVRIIGLDAATVQSRLQV